ncbi:hypothetical protein D3C71_1905980 [compost metagenome]
MPQASVKTAPVVSMVWALSQPAGVKLSVEKWKGVAFVKIIIGVAGLISAGVITVSNRSL